MRDGSTDQFIGAGVLTRYVTGVLTDLLGLGILARYVTAELTDLLGLEYLPGAWRQY